VFRRDTWHFWINGGLSTALPGGQPADLTKVFMLVLAPVAIILVLMSVKQPSPEWKKRILIFMGIVEVGLLTWILVTTFLDNRNIFKTLLAFTEANQNNKVLP